MAQHKDTPNLSEAASILGRKDTTPEARHEAARILGKKGGTQSHGGKGTHKRTGTDEQE